MDWTATFGKYCHSCRNKANVKMYRAGCWISILSNVGNPRNPQVQSLKSNSDSCLFSSFKGSWPKKKDQISKPPQEATVSNIKDCTIFVGGYNGEFVHVNPRFSAENMDKATAIYGQSIALSIAILLSHVDHSLNRKWTRANFPLRL